MEEIAFYYIMVYIISFFGLFTGIFFILTIVEHRDHMKTPKINLNDKDLPSVTVVIPAYNEEKGIGVTIRSVQNLDYPREKLRIIVVDDGSTDNTYNEAKKFCLKDKRVKVFTKENGGVASATNYGIKRADTDLIAPLDADSFVTRDALKNMIGYLNNPNVVVVTPALTVYNPRGFLQKLQYAEYTLSIYLRRVFGFMNSITVTPGPFSLYRKAFFDKYGGYDEDNITQDIEIALRIQKNGYKIENSMDGVVYTIAPNKFKALLKQRMRWYFGFITNVLKNKDLFNPKYGYLALLILPSAFVAVLFAIAFFSYFIYKNVLDYGIDRIIEFSVLGKDMFFINLKNIKLQTILDSITNMFLNPLIMLVIVSILITVITLTLAKRASSDKRNMFLATIYFLFTYWFFYAIWWLSVLIYRFMLGQKLAWGKRKY